MIAGTIGGMMRKFSWMLLVLLAFSAYAEDKDLPVVSSAKELKAVKAKKIVWKKDEAEMVLIPAGSFEMGDYLDGMSNAPVHPVELDGFYMDVNEVTVGQFKQFVNQSGYDYPEYWDKVAMYSPGDN